MNDRKVAVLGCGLMGNQIAIQCAVSGYQVWCCDCSREMIEKAAGFAEDWFRKKVEKGRMSESEADLRKGDLHFTVDMKEAVTDCRLVIEAVPDKLNLKRQVLSEADRYAGENTYFASNSSYLASSLFCSSIRHPERLANLHFFNPALVMELVEVVRGPHVSEETVEFLMGFAGTIHKTPVLVEKEIYGFVVNRIFSAITKEACYLLDQGIASAADVDLAVKKGLGHPMGPFELLDMTGIDLEYQVLTERYRSTKDLCDKPSPAIVEHFAKGEYGRKTGKGFYGYE